MCDATTDGFPDYFSDDAEAYRRYRPRYPAGLFDYLASIAPGRDQAWDAGTGNGQVALDLATRFARVLATDASATQLAAAPSHARITYRVARAEDGGPAPGTCDLVTAAQALHWFDAPRFFTEVRRALRPGGVIAVWCYGHAQVSSGVDTLLAAFLDRVGPYWPPERSLVDTGYAAIPFPFHHRSDVPALTLGMSWTAADFLGYLGTWSASRRCREARGVDPLEGIRDEIGAAWGPGAREVRWPLHLRVGSP